MSMLPSLQDFFRPQVRENYRRSYYILLIAGVLATSKIAMIVHQRSVYLTDLGMSFSLYGLLLGIGSACIFFVQIGIGRFSDIIQTRKKIVLVAIAIDMVLLSIFLVTRNLTILSVALVAEVVCHSQIFQLLLVMVGDIAEEHGYGASFGQYKAAGSFAWLIVATIAGTLFEVFGFRILVVSALAAYLAMFLLLLQFKEPPFHHQEVDAPRPSFHPKGELGYALLSLCALSLMIRVQDGGGMSYFMIYMQRNMLLSASFAGLVLAITGFFEIPFTILGGKLFDRYNKKALILIGCLLGTTRWILLPLIGNKYLLFGIQLQNAMIMTVMMVGIPSYVSSMVPLQYRGTVFGVLSSVGSIGSTIGPVLMGRLGDSIGFNWAMIVNGSFGILGVFVFGIFVILPGIVRRKERSNACRACHSEP